MKVWPAVAKVVGAAKQRFTKSWRCVWLLMYETAVPVPSVGGHLLPRAAPGGWAARATRVLPGAGWPAPQAQTKETPQAAKCGHGGMVSVGVVDKIQIDFLSSNQQKLTIGICLRRHFRLFLLLL